MTNDNPAPLTNDELERINAVLREEGVPYDTACFLATIAADRREIAELKESQKWISLKQRIDAKDREIERLTMQLDKNSRIGIGLVKENDEKDREIAEQKAAAIRMIGSYLECSSYCDAKDCEIERLRKVVDAARKWAHSIQGSQSEGILAARLICAVAALDNQEGRDG